MAEPVSNFDYAIVRLTLAELDDQDNPAKSKPGIGVDTNFIIASSMSFAINSIPTATVSVPLGSELQAYSVYKSWVYSELKDAIEKRRAYGIYATIHLKDWCGYYTPKGNKEAKHPLGRLCLFRGYITSLGLNLQHGRGEAEVGLTHWLTDLDSFSVLNPLSAPDNSLDVSMDRSMETTMGEGNSMKTTRGKTGWIPGIDAQAVVSASNTVWEAIRILLTKALQENTKTPDIAGGLNPELHKKVEYILGTSEGSNRGVIDGTNSKPAANLDMMDKAISGSIGKVLSEQVRSEYYSITVWQKLVSSLLPQFYLSLLPTVDGAFIVPDPGLTCDDTKELTTITANQTTSVQYNKSRDSLVSGMVLIAPDGITKARGSGSFLSRFQYPKPERRSIGSIKAAYMPQWLSSAYQIKSTLQLSGTVSLDSISSKSEQKPAVPSNPIAGLCKAWVKGAYVNEVTKGNRVTVTTVFNPWFRLGDFVKIEAGQDILTEKEPLVLYGIIQSITHTLNQNNLTTTMSISNVRDEAMQKSLPILKGVLYDVQQIDGKLFYKEEWDGEEFNSH